MIPRGMAMLPPLSSRQTEIIRYSDLARKSSMTLENFT